MVTKTSKSAAKTTKPEKTPKAEEPVVDTPKKTVRATKSAKTENVSKQEVVPSPPAQEKAVEIPLEKPAKTTKSVKSNKTNKSDKTEVEPAKTAKAEKAPKKVKETKKEVSEDSPQEEKPSKGNVVKGEKQRHFKVTSTNPPIEHISKNGGRYKAKAPMQAAKKAFKQIVKTIEGKSVTLEFEIQECTQDSDHKPYKYVGTRVERDEPQTIVRGGQEYQIKHDTKIKAIKSPKTTTTKKRSSKTTAVSAEETQ